MLLLIKNKKKSQVAILAIQTKNGKAFEFATLISLQSHLSNNQQVVILNTPALVTAQQFYSNIGGTIRRDMDLAANAAIRVLLRMEPQLENPYVNTPLYLSIQGDASGIAGDVRDVLTVRIQNQWEIGISCKHNHTAIKHSRLSSTIDFGNLWFGIPCSASYFQNINPIFEELRVMRQSGMLWSSVPNKDVRFYVPILEHFMSEIRRLDTANPNRIPGLLLRYLLGTNDFYKVITHDRRRVTQIQAFSLYGTLNHNAGAIRTQKLPQLALPNHFYDINFKAGSRNTIRIVCDEGWAINMRIHSAASLVEPSLKFDVTLIGVPPNLHTQHEPWN